MPQALLALALNRTIESVTEVVEVYASDNLVSGSDPTLQNASDAKSKNPKQERLPSAAMF